MQFSKLCFFNYDNKEDDAAWLAAANQNALNAMLNQTLLGNKPVRNQPGSVRG